jgi:ribosomal protein S1
MILSEREALREERLKIMETIEVGNEYDGVVSGVSSY